MSEIGKLENDLLEDKKKQGTKFLNQQLKVTQDALQGQDLSSLFALVHIKIN